MFEEFARDAGLQSVEVISLVPAGADPHTYQFTPADIERMKGIDFFFVNGLGLDAHLQEVIEENRDESAFVIPFAPNIRSPQGGEITAEEAGDNAHLWLDPTLAYVYPEIVADELIIYDGVRSQFYTDNFAASRERLLALQGEVQAIIDSIPAERRALIVKHDSFDHFARRFGLTAPGHLIESPASTPTSDDIARAVQLVRDQQAPAVFTEFGYDPAPMQQVASQAGVPLCTLYSDIIEPGQTYSDLMLANAREISRCLGGS
jgi:zinc/manganese transport system substrate-binding protein